MCLPRDDYAAFNSGTCLSSAPASSRCPGTFTVYALILSNPAPGGADTETECATLDEALCQLSELVLSEMEDPDGPRFERYGLFLS